MPDRERRVEVRHRLLRDVGDTTTSDAEHGLHVDHAVPHEDGFLEADRAREDAGGARQQTEDRERGLRLARSGFADEAQDLTGSDGEGHVADHTGVLALGVRIADAQIGDLQDRLGVVDHGRLPRGVLRRRGEAGAAP